MESSGVAAETGKGNAYQTPLRDKSYGRIWRVYPKGTPNESAPRLDPQNADTLVAALGDSNMFWRLQAQRLLVEGGHREAAPALRSLVANGGTPAVHAFHTLAGLDLLDATTVGAGLPSKEFGVRRAAFTIAAQTYPELLSQHVLGNSSNALPAGGARESLELFSALSHLPASTDVGQRLFEIAAANEELFSADPVFAGGWQLAARAHADGVINAALAANLSPETLDQSLAGQVVQLIAWSAGTAPEKRAALLAVAEKQDNAFARYVATSLKVEPAKTATAVKFERDTAVHVRGAPVYANTCVACHGIDGRGVPDVFPPLAGADWVTGSTGVPIRIVLHGLTGPVPVNGATYNNVMPPLFTLNDAEIADVVTYVRQNFGNDAAPVSESEVQEIRRDNRQPREMWTAEELKSLSN
jgi:mono/diheme cytochrome c family protein